MLRFAQHDEPRTRLIRLFFVDRIQQDVAAFVAEAFEVDLEDEVEAVVEVAYEGAFDVAGVVIAFRREIDPFPDDASRHGDGEIIGCAHALARRAYDARADNIPFVAIEGDIDVTAIAGFRHDVARPATGYDIGFIAQVEQVAPAECEEEEA